MSTLGCVLKCTCHNLVWVPCLSQIIALARDGLFSLFLQNKDVMTSRYVHQF